MTTLIRLPSPNGSRHPSVRPLANPERRRTLRLTDRAHRLGVVLLAGGMGGSFGLIFGASTVDHPGAGGLLYHGGRR